MASICTLSAVSSAAPRVSFEVRIFRGKVELESKGKTGGTFVISPAMVASLHELRQPIAYKGAARVPSKLMLALVEPLKIQRSEYAYLVLSAKPGTPGDFFPESEWKANGFDGVDLHADVLVELFPKALGKELERPQSSTFRSQEGHSSLRCHFKTNDGMLHPMRSGLIFAPKPVLYIPSDSVSSIDYCTAPTTFELVVTCEEPGAPEACKTIAFSNIESGERETLENYFVEMKKQKKKKTTPGKVAAAAQLSGPTNCGSAKVVVKKVVDVSSPLASSSRVERPCSTEAAVCEKPASDSDEDPDDSDWNPDQASEVSEDEDSSQDDSNSDSNDRMHREDVQILDDESEGDLKPARMPTGRKRKGGPDSDRP